MPIIEHKLRSRTRPSLDDPFELDGKMYKVVWSEPVNYVWADGSRTWRLGLHLIEEKKTMDPNETLRKLREIVDDTLTSVARGKRFSKIDEMADLFHALDEWLAKGGFPPDAWGRAVHKDVMIQIAIDSFRLRGCGDGAHVANADGQPFPKRCARCARVVDIFGMEVK